VFLHRHFDPNAPGHNSVPPHRINYRANIAALKQLGVTGIVASTAVGSLRAGWPSGTLVLLDQFIDCTTQRAKTFFDERAVHIDVTQPYCPRLRALLLQTAAQLNLALHDGGTYLCTDGPRFETPAEIRVYAQWGADVVGMTGVPEVTLAREAGIAYAGVSIVTNAAAGISAQPLTQAEVLEAMSIALPRVAELFLAASRLYEDDPTAPSRRATAEFETHDFDPAALFG
jgi:5'-methylthioadenosine phosphorylase